MQLVKDYADSQLIMSRCLELGLGLLICVEVPIISYFFCQYTSDIRFEFSSRFPK